MKRIELVLLIMMVFSMTACVRHSLSSVSYPRHTAQTALRVTPGRVISVQEVRIEGEYGVVGTVGGAAIGRAAGRSVGGGSGRTLAGAAVGVAGAVAGQAVEKALTAENGVEITIELDNGEVLAIVQSADVHFAQGERVRVLRGRGTARVQHL